MKERLQKRLGELKTELASGQQMLAELEAKKANLQETLLRISGAVQVLEEELEKTEEDNSKLETPINSKVATPAETVSQVFGER